MEKRIQCTVCKKVKYSKFTDNQLNLIAPVDSKVEKGTEVDFGICVDNYFSEHTIEDVQCSQCDKRCNFNSRFRFLKFPRTLCVVLQRFVFDEWVPKKLEIELQVPDGAKIDFQKYMSATDCKPAEGEEAMPEAAENEEVEPELDQALLNMVCQMGIPENPAKHALYKSGGTDADLAVTWYFENMADESINLPLRVKKAGAPSSGDEVPREMVEMMLAMGFPEKKCIKALKKCDNNPERATDWLFSHMDDPDSDVKMTEEVKNEEEYSCDKPGFYKLQSFITHLGASVHAGHYVCHVKKDGKWVYFNDAKVAETTEPPIGKGYLYFFQKD